VVAVFAWLDSSERDRRRTLDVIDLFKQRDTVDELGLGSVRDTVADVLAPGTSTIQTRARYFFFIPWIYMALEARRGSGEKAATRARSAEIKLIPELVRTEDRNGVIGQLAGASLKRLPSSVYWAGLLRLGFRLFSGSRDYYHRHLDRSARANSPSESNDEPFDHVFRGNWNPHIPKAPDDFPSGASFDLTRAEAEFFREQIRMHASGSLLHFLVEKGEHVEELDAPWRHVDVPHMPDKLQQWLKDGQCYSELMDGAQLLYNLLLAEKRGRADWIADYKHFLHEWGAALESRLPVLREWNRSAFWFRLRFENPNLPIGVERFSEAWINFVLAAPVPAAVIDDPAARRMIAERERTLKGNRARLFSQPHLDLWGGASGTAPLNYRWRITRTIVNDIVAGSGRDHA